jgi:trigger factor
MRSAADRRRAVGGFGGTSPRYRGRVASDVETHSSDVGEARVRIEAKVAPAAVDRAVDSAAGELGRELKVPGFRKGKVPPAVVLRRVGRESVLDEAVRQALPEWYEEAIRDASVVPVGDPNIDLSELPARGEPLTFTVEVAVRPTAKLGNYKGLEVGRREPDVAPAAIDAELERLREASAELETVDRAAGNGDFVVIDFTGRVDGEPFEGGEARGYVLELGSNRLVEGFEEQLDGARAGDEREVRVSFPADYRAEALAGKDAVFDVAVREVKEKRLPDIDDGFAEEAGGFDTLDELRADIESRLRTAAEREIDTEFREAVVDSAAAEAKIDVPSELIHAKAHEMWHQTARRLRAQGVDPQRYLEMTGKSEEQLVTDAEPEAEQALRRESVLAAVVEAEKIDVSDDELLDSLRRATSGGSDRPPSERKLERAKAEGRDEPLREDIAMRKAVDMMVESAKAIPVEQAKAREKLWTPEKDAGEAQKAEEIWTP